MDDTIIYYNLSNNYYNHTNYFTCSNNDTCYYFSFIFTFFFFCILTICCFLVKTNKNAKRKIYNYNLYFKDKGAKDSNIRNCVICFENINYENLIILKCDHYFHEGCIKKWLVRNLNCPICRNNFNEIL